FVQAFAHQHHVGDACAHVNGEEVLMHDTRDDNVQKAAFDCYTPCGIALFITIPTVSCRSLFLVLSDDIRTSFDSFRKLLDNQTHMIESLLCAELNGRKHSVLARFPKPFIHDLVDALPQDG